MEGLVHCQSPDRLFPLVKGIGGWQGCRVLALDSYFGPMALWPLLHGIAGPNLPCLGPHVPRPMND